jgi:beta-glucanase (GH16 family)
VYTNKDENVHIDSGYLHISALSPFAESYTSGRITTLGKKEYTYGRVEIRAKLPQGQGVWPALWMLGANIGSVNWPSCGEIDIMELLGHQPEKVYGTVHWDDNGHAYIGSNTSLAGSTFNTDFHLFTLVWTPNRMTWMVDREPYYTLTRTEISKFPFDLPEFLIFNVAVGGYWPGPPDGTTLFPQHMLVDYVRWYQ